VGAQAVAAMVPAEVEAEAARAKYRA